MRRSLPGVELDDRIDALAQRGLADRALRGAILQAISPMVPFDSYVWLSTDPETAVGCVPLAEVPDVRQVPSLIRNRYLVEERHWANPLTHVVTTLAGASNGTLGQRTWTEQLAVHGVTDVATMVLRDAYGCWGFIDLWRIGGTFSAKECTTLEACASAVTRAARCSLLGTFAQSTTGGAPMDEPAIVLLDDELSLITQTAQAQAHLRALLPPSPDHAPIPAAVYNVAAQLLANEVGVGGHAARARLPLGGRWLTTRAARAWPAAGRPAAIAVSIERATRDERTDIYARVAGLSAREGEILRLLVIGGDTREISERLFLSAHTVQDHLKSIFAKTGVHNRKILIAHATG